MTAHSYLSASASHRWSECPGSAVLAARVPPSPGGAAAKRGTELHAEAEDALRTWRRLSKTPVGPEEADIIAKLDPMIQPYVAYVRSLTAGHHVWLEQQVNYSGALGVEDGTAFGTADCIALSHDGKTVHVVDYKSGAMKVDPMYNSQLLLYAAGAVEFIGMLGFDLAQVERFYMTIVQPSWGDNPMTWEADRALVHEGVAQLAKAATLACKHKEANVDQLAAEDLLHADENHCRWCPAVVQCPAIKAAREAFGTVPPAPAGKVTPAAFKPVIEIKPVEDIKTMYAQVALMRIWCEAVEAEMFARTQAGETTGYKLVEGRAGNRAWTDEARAEMILKANGFKEIYTEPKLLSPTQIEMLVKKHPEVMEEINEVVTRPPGKPTLAPMSDPRPVFEEKRSEKMAGMFIPVGT